MKHQDIIKYVNKNNDNYQVIKLKKEASLRSYYRVNHNNKTYILLDSIKEPKQFNSLLRVYNIIKNLNVSIPKICNIDYKNYIICLEDFGNNRFDKLINKPKYTSHLLKISIDSLIILKNSFANEKKLNLQKYNYNIFKSEISEFIDYYYPFLLKKNISDINKKDFFEVWNNLYKNINLKLDSFVHKDFFCNNLFYLPDRKKHLQCGIIDFQDAFIGDAALDMVSLLQDSRRIIKYDYKADLINYYLTKTNQLRFKEEFLIRLNFIGALRQTRLLGRWIKLFKKSKQKQYLSYINTTWSMLENNLDHDSLLELKKLYKNLIPLKVPRYEN